MDGKEVLWSEIASRISKCSKCDLHKYRTNPVPGEGSLYSKMLFIGEAPGKSEDEEGRPFVGAAGKLLTELLEVRGIKRSEVFITNVVKCRPPNNREPYDDEVNACGEHTISIIKLVSPKLVVTLGNHAGKFIFGLGCVRWVSVSKMRGKGYEMDLLGIKGVLVIPTYHPATALYNPKIKSVLEEDFDMIKRYYLLECHGLESVKRRHTLLDFIEGDHH